MPMIHYFASFEEPNLPHSLFQIGILHENKLEKQLLCGPKPSQEDRLEISEALNCTFRTFLIDYLGFFWAVPQRRGSSGSIFKITKGRALQLETFQKQFFWRGNSESKPHLINWKIVSRLKDKGGFGIGGIVQRNLAHG